jgi:ABC-type branched-subunit amino acid transport system substrate-binding protein
MPARRLGAVLLALMLTAACGARLDPKLRAEAVNGALSGTGGSGRLSNSGAGSTGDGSNGSGTDLTGAGTGTGTGTGAGGGSSSGGSSSGATGAGGGAAAPAGGNGGATDVGVTETTITVGNVADLSGPVPGLFQAAPYGAEAYFAYINSQGGIYGRKLKLLTADSQTDCTANQNAHSNLMSKVFAFVGSFSLYDDCGTKIMEEHPDVSDLSYGLGSQTKANKTNNFPPQVAPVGYQNGMFCYWAQKYGDAVKHVGSVYPNIPSVVLSQRMIEHAAESCGWVWTDRISVGATDTTFNAAVNKMQQDGVRIIFEVATNGQNAAELKREWDAQATGAAKSATWIMPIAYASDFVERMGSAAAAEGIVGHNLYSLFFNPDDARNIPEVGLFQEWMKKVHPRDAMELYAMYSWAAAKLFVQELKEVGPKLTRKAFIDAIRKVHSYDAGGLVNGSDLANRTPSNCYVLWVLHNGAFSRVDTPANAYRCDGTFVPYSG